jgi:hypothetical protein
MPTLNTELQRLSTLKDLTEVKGRDYKAQSADFKEQQTKCLDLMEAQGCKSWRGEDGTLYTRCEDRVKGQVEDRRLYIRYCLEQDEGVQEFLNWAWEKGDELELHEKFYDLLVGGLELVAVKEKQDRCNAQARAHIDDEAPLPPGLTFRPDPYIQQRRS